MTTFDSYAAAKIANPNSEIVTTCDSWTGGDELKGKFEALNSDPRETHLVEHERWVICNPADHCQTVEKFLADGHKFVEGDICLRDDGDVITVTESVLDWNVKDELDGKRFILRAAALEEKPNPALTGGDVNLIETLFDGFNRITGERDYDSAYDIACEMLELEGEISKEEKPKRMREEYVKLDEGNFNVWDLKELLSVGELFSKTSDGRYVLYSENSPNYMLRHFSDYGVYRRVEVEVSERDAVAEILEGGQDTPYFEFNGEFMIIDGGVSIKQLRAITDILDNSGKFKLVEGK